MNARYSQSGKSMAYTPGSAVDAGDIVVTGSFVGVALSPIAANALGAIELEGTFDIAKDNTSGPTFAVGDPVFFNTSTELAVNDPGTGVVFLGFAVAAAGASDAWVRTRFQPDALESFVYTLADLSAGSDLAATIVWPGLPRGGHLVDVSICGQANSAGIDGSNTSVWTVADNAGNTIVTLTFNATTTFPAAGALRSLGACSATHRVLAADEAVKLTVTNGSTADTPVTLVRFTYVRKP